MKERSPSHTLYLFLYIGIFLFLAIPALKLGGGVRIGQFFILLTFMLLLADDIVKHTLDKNILFYFGAGALVMTLVSMNSIEMKFGESKFVIKYFLIFPAAFYVGAKVFERIGARFFIKLLEAAMFFYALMAYIIEFLPLPSSILDKIVSYRTGFGGIQYLDFQGTFFEAGWLAMVLGALFISALLLRIAFDIRPKHTYVFLIFYLMIFATLAMTKNKTIWIAFVLIMLILVIYKSIIMLLYSNKYQPQNIAERDPLLKLLHHIDPVKILLGVFFFLILFFIINMSLSDPLISSEMLKEKLEKERGKAFLIIWEMLKESYYFGGYGFGFVEAYFTLLPQDVLGLGEGSAMIFNSYLDIWLSASLFGLAFHLGLVYIALNKHYFITLVLPMYYFIFANFNPATGDEYYYLFLGISYGTAITLQKQKKAVI